MLGSYNPYIAPTTKAKEYVNIGIENFVAHLSEPTLKSLFAALIPTAETAEQLEEFMKTGKRDRYQDYPWDRC